VIRSLHRGALASIALALAVGCDFSVWLSDDLDASVAPDAPPHDAPPDAPVDAPEIDAGPRRACEVEPSVLGSVLPTGPDEQPTFAVSAAPGPLRYGVLVPPVASATVTTDTALIIADGEGNPVRTHALAIDAVGGGPTSTATLHSLSPESTTPGFLVLGPTAIWLLDEMGIGGPVAIPTPPSPPWQRSAGWIDADRFAFVTSTADLRVAVFDRTTMATTETPISAAGAARVLVEPGGVTISRAAVMEVVVYSPALDGTEILRTSWTDEPGNVLGERLLAAAVDAGERRWLVRGAARFDNNVTEYTVPAAGDPVQGSARVVLVTPITASLEGPVVALQGSPSTLTIYSLASRTFTSLPPPDGVALVESEREGEQVAVLTLRLDGSGDLSLELECAVR
jgi:hypothetical protein